LDGHEVKLAQLVLIVYGAQIASVGCRCHRVVQALHIVEHADLRIILSEIDVTGGAVTLSEMKELSAASLSQTLPSWLSNEV
jgi:hypothetical protein